ncbi:MAG: hypothetical protein KKF02_12900 [Proteobacteria bacterium]|nr:hypothetical protein [Pseudomonadota bacterium]
MPAHSIIDNRREKLVDHINRILETSEAARFAVGYFFLSGLTAISEKLSYIKERRLLIGNTTNRKTLEQIAEGVPAPGDGGRGRQGGGGNLGTGEGN